MNLHTDKKLFEQAIRATSQYKGLREIYVEKDYWVTFALSVIFNSEMKNSVVFKGGTALSKCYGMIRRFSEDIDLVLLKKENDTGNQLKTRLKKISKLVSQELPEFYLENITQKMGMNRKTAHSYSHMFKDDFGQVRDCIILETTWLGSHEPYLKQKVNSFIYEMMVSKGQIELAEKYNLLPFEVLTLEIKRTLCEKIMSLVRFSRSNNPIRDLSLKIRHIYDINQILNDNELYYFFKSDDFEKLLIKVAKDDVYSFKNNNKWLAIHPLKAIIFSDTQYVWTQISKVYFGVFSKLVYGQLPGEKEIIKTIDTVKKRIKTINWIDIENELKNKNKKKY